MTATRQNEWPMHTQVRIALVVIGSVVLGMALAGTVYSLVHDRTGSSNGEILGGAVAGLGLALLLTAFVRDGR